MSKNVAIILAAGNGQRFRDRVPKQFANLNNKLIIDYSIQTFLANSAINEIVIVCNNDWIEFINKKYPQCKVVEGGDSRQKSSFIGLKSCSHNTKNVLIHDGARPFVSDVIINNAIEKLKEFDAVNLSIPSSDTVVFSKEKLISYIPSRKEVFLSQTPQSFKYNVILEAHKKSRLDNVSDDIQLVKNLNITCYNLIGSIDNIKITYPLDIQIAELIIKNNK